ncbi:hypothetical protein RJC13_04570 [Staphylococcus hominis]|uniref:hypothetical protein n=1 Tax=Staphylococcus hominis TaxID=1290 RepID=UPI000910AE3F|nr:hypothetical protein [Staphylococcus hominis]MCI2872926.1 hypothetical protein [Staphylococcus hominis]MDS3895723.1 hypothetical protein [Staphylococcus hominis]RNE52741.1 hypothetical protein EEI51_05850 [Staphylococcus hominis]SFX65760.1 hypothetical protein SAMN04487789_12115 [Staphylococcus hominis]
MQELNIDEKNAIELSMLAIENRTLKQRIALKDEIIDDLMKDIRYWSTMYQSANTRADKNAQDIARCTEVHERERNSHLYNQTKR